jgi:Carboxypeptidase regulatory-like domain
MNKVLLASLLLMRMSLALRAQNGVVTGQVRDASGKPIEAVRVAATEPSSSALVAIGETNSTGQYRLENIPPGRYFIMAGLIDYPTYYPGVTGEAGAKAVEIRAGKAVEGVSFALQRPTTVKVRGHLPGLKPGASLPIAMFGTTGTPLQTDIKPDGSFAFDKVPLGSYTLQAPGVIPVNVAVVDKDVNIDLTPLYWGPGVHVSGKVIGRSGALQPGIRRTVILNPIATNPVTGSLMAVPGTLGTSIHGALETLVNGEGSFEFSAVPPGPYLLRILPAAPGVPSPRLDVATRDVGGLEIAVPFQFDVPGRVVLDGHDIGSNALIEASQGSFTTSTSIPADGAFRLRLTEGENRISLARLPLNVSVKSITYGHKDVTHTSLTIERAAPPQELVVRLETLPIDSISGVKVSGRATGPGQQSVVGLGVSLAPAGPNGKATETTVQADGTFEFPRVTNGTYMLRFAAPVTAFSRIFVGGQDVTGIEIPIGARLEVAGQVRALDGQGKIFPLVPANLSLTFRVASGGSVVATMGADRTFRILLPEDRYTLVVENLPPSYAIKSIASGSLDLLKETLKIDAQSPPPPIEVVLEYRAARE